MVGLIEVRLDCISEANLLAGMVEDGRLLETGRVFYGLQVAGGGVIVVIVAIGVVLLVLLGMIEFRVL